MNSLTRKGLILIVSVVTLLVTACSLPGSSKGTMKQVFVLQGEAGSTVSGDLTAMHCLSLRLSLPESAPGFNTVRMAYQIEPNRLDYFAYHEWAATPARMLASVMEGRLDASGMFGAVISGSADIRTELRLDSEVLALQQDFSEQTSAVWLAIKVNLVDVSNRSLIGSRAFSYRVPAAEQNAEAGVVAANQATDQYLNDLLAFLSESVSSIQCPVGQ